MVHNKYRISSKQATALGMLSSEAGLAAMANVLQATSHPISVLGAAPVNYWTNLLSNAPGVPSIFGSIDVPLPTAKGARPASGGDGASAPAAATSESSIRDKVLEVLTSVLGVDVDVDQPLALQGLDSLAGLEFRQKLQEALGVELALLAEDPQGATASSIISEAVLKIQLSTFAASGQGDLGFGQIGVAEDAVPAGPLWISPSPITVKMRLFCLPWAGGVSENLFSRWSMMLPASIQVCPVEIPGRGRREGEASLTTVDELARILAHSLPLQDKPYVIFGTCLGAIVGYEIIREVERTGCAPLPVAFMPAAVSPPHVYASVVMKIYLQRKLRKYRPLVFSYMHICTCILSNFY